jgi:hypothetical protein
MERFGWLLAQGYTTHQAVDMLNLSTPAITDLLHLMVEKCDRETFNFEDDDTENQAIERRAKP